MEGLARTEPAVSRACSAVSLSSTCCRGLGTILKLGGGRGKRLPGSKRYLKIPKAKNFPDFAHCFLGGTQVHVQKQANIKMNDIDSPKLEGWRASGPKVGGTSALAASPIPGPMTGMRPLSRPQTTPVRRL